jgi:hypothetical protein
MHETRMMVPTRGGGAARRRRRRRGRRRKRQIGTFLLSGFFLRLGGGLRSDGERRRVGVLLLLLRERRRRGLDIVREGRSRVGRAGDDVLVGFEEDVWGVVFCVVDFDRLGAAVDVPVLRSGSGVRMGVWDGERLGGDSRCGVVR